MSDSLGGFSHNFFYRDLNVSGLHWHLKTEAMHIGLNADLDLVIIKNRWVVSFSLFIESFLVIHEIVFLLYP